MRGRLRGLALCIRVQGIASPAPPWEGWAIPRDGGVPARLGPRNGGVEALGWARGVRLEAFSGPVSTSSVGPKNNDHTGVAEPASSQSPWCKSDLRKCCATRPSAASVTWAEVRTV